MPKIKIRQALEKDTPFIAWVMHEAARSHLEICPWEIIFDEPEIRTLVLLEKISRIPELYWSYFANFWIAEVDAIPVAAMCGFSPEAENGINLAALQLSVVQQDSEYEKQKILDTVKRLETATLGLPAELQGVWGIESVAVIPAYRGKGIIDILFNQVFEEGRKKGFNQAQIMCLLGNTQGQHVFERNGFNVVSENKNAEFEALFGTSGAKLLVKQL